MTALALRVASVGLVVGLSGGCAHGALVRGALASERLALGVERLQATVEVLYGAGMLPAGDYRAWQRAFSQMADIGLRYNAALRASDGASAADQVRAWMGLLDDVSARELGAIPLERRGEVALAIEGLRAVLLTLSLALEG